MLLAIWEGPDSSTDKEKADLPKFQVVLQNYFSIPNEYAFSNVSQDGGRTIKGLASMGFSKDPKQCLNKANGDLQMIGCGLFYKKCQEVDTILRLILIKAPNQIKEEIIYQTMDKELQHLEHKLLLTNKEDKILKRQLSKWMKFTVVQEFLAGMPWEGAEEKKQKQDTNNACLAYVLHVHTPDYFRIKALLSHAKDEEIWHKHWGNAAFTVETPDEKDNQGVKTKYIQTVQTYGSVNLSMGAAQIEGKIDINTTFTLCLTPDTDGKPWKATTQLAGMCSISFKSKKKRCGSVWSQD
jgi:hypothetical protein